MSRGEKELEDVLAELERHGERERKRLLEEARGLEDYPGKARAQETLQRLAAGDSPGEKPRGRELPRRLPLFAAAAAVLLALVAVWALSPRDPGPSDDLFLSDTQLRPTAPLGEQTTYGAFEWEFSLPPGGYYELRLWDASVDEEAPLFFIEELLEPRWTPDPEAARSLPASVRWRVTAYDATRSRLASGSASASLSSH